MTTETITSGKYTFVVSENKMVYDKRIISHTFRIGGTYNDCISISYTYNDNVPISAKIVFVRYEPECPLESNLEKGGGTTIMLKTFLQHVVRKIPSITTFMFEDMSHIDCHERDLSIPPPRSPTRPLSLAYLSIAYNSCTWYEKHFDAKMTDNVRYANYRKSLKFLTDPTAKLDFISFLQIVQPPSEQCEYLEYRYKTTTTYRKFFDTLPIETRCDTLRPWLKTFMEYYLGNTYSSYNWEINVTSPKITGGNKLKKTRRQSTKRNYPPTYKIITYNDMHLL